MIFGEETHFSLLCIAPVFSSHRCSGVHQVVAGFCVREGLASPKGKPHCRCTGDVGNLTCLPCLTCQACTIDVVVFMGSIWPHCFGVSMNEIL